MKKNPIGILGGTFDPIHFGHLRMALELRDLLKLKEVRLIPCKQPVHKEKTFATTQQRKSMLELAILNEPNLIVDTREIDRTTPSYMVETLESLKQDFKDTPLCLIMGIDALAKLDSWHSWQDILKLCHIVAIERPDYKFDWDSTLAHYIKAFVATEAKKLKTQESGLIYFEKVTLLNISATNIRNLIHQRKDPRYLLPESVLGFIRENNLYNDRQ